MGRHLRERLDMHSIDPGLEKERIAAVKQLVNDVVDPCSMAAGVPLGLGDMGIVQGVDVDEGGTVRIELLPTFPACRFVPIFQEEIERRIAAVPWVSRVIVTIASADQLWDESRMTQAGRLKLLERRSGASDERMGRSHLRRDDAGDQT